MRQSKVCYSERDYPNSADLFCVSVLKIGAKIHNDKKSASIGYFLLCLVFRFIEEYLFGNKQQKILFIGTDMRTGFGPNFLLVWGRFFFLATIGMDKQTLFCLEIMYS